MNDAFIDNLKGEWQNIDAGPEVDFDKLRRNFLRRRFVSMINRGLEFIGTILAVIAGVYLARTMGGWLGWGSAVMLVFVLAALFTWNYRIWRNALHWEDRGPEGRRGKDSSILEYSKLLMPGGL